MAIYQSTPINRHVEQAVPGTPVYLLGSGNVDTANTVMRITTVGLSGTTATVTGTVIEGQIPVVGQQISISGASPSYFNVSNATILSVTGAATPDVGVYSFTFTLTNSNIVPTASVGTVVGFPPETGDAINLGGNSAWKSAACTIQSIQSNNGGKGLRASIRYPTALGGAASVILQTADVDLEGAYVSVGSAISTGLAGATMYAGTNAIVANFVRFSITGISVPGTGKIVGTILIV